MRKRDGLCPYSFCKDASSADETLFGISVYRGRRDDEEIRGWASVGTPGEDLEAAGRGVEPGNAGKLGDPADADLAEAAVPTHEAAAARRSGDPRG